MSPIDSVALFVFAAVLSGAVWTDASWRRSSLLGGLSLAAHYALWHLFGQLAARSGGDTGPVLLGFMLLLLEVPACATLVVLAVLVIKLKEREPPNGAP